MTGPSRAQTTRLIAAQVRGGAAKAGRTGALCFARRFRRADIAVPADGTPRGPEPGHGSY